MLRKLVCAFAILGLSIGLAVAEELKVKITKIDGNKITYEEKGQAPKTVEAAADVKVSKMVKKNKEAVPGGLKAEGLKVGDKGLNATINVEAGKVTEIILGGGKKKKDAN